MKETFIRRGRVPNHARPCCRTKQLATNLRNGHLVLPLPERLTPSTRQLPTAEEVAPWVEAIIRLWDDAELYDEHHRRSLTEAERWRSEWIEPRDALLL